ncbi:MAG: methyltransferase domain-containing protein [Coriobacteriia bacterium]|nr:methyltransferase domain-containing protein [Coriobacteriia bacterium]
MADLYSPGAVPEYLKEVVKDIPSDVLEHTRGVGYPFPLALEGAKVLVLGCGAGRDAYIASKLVGENGLVIGVDENEALIDIALKNAPENCQFFAFPLDELNKIQSGSIDVVLSNGSLSRCNNVQKTLAEVFRVLNYGGEFYGCDIFADRRIPLNLLQKKGEEPNGLSNALYIEDFRRLMTQAGWLTTRHVSTRPLRIQDERFADIAYFKRTFRTYKLPDKLEDLCEQYNQTATYLGGIEGAGAFYDLDDHHRFEKDVPLDVCGNSCAMVQDTRVGKYFKITGNRHVHYGPFPGCGNIPYAADEEDESSAASSCSCS